MPESPKPGQQNPPVERSGTLVEPDSNLSPRQAGRPQPVERSGTLIETEDDVRQALLPGQKGRQPRPAVAAELSPAPPVGSPIQPMRARGRVPSDGAAAGCRADGV